MSSAPPHHPSPPPRRAYFRSRVKEGGEGHYGGSLRLAVRRDHVFEDSFYQLRMRTPAEMRCKLNIQFQGEEGVDAGGVTREWYQVPAGGGCLDSAAPRLPPSPFSQPSIGLKLSRL